MRILILSDIHANFVALDTVLADAKNEYEAVWCLGDVIGYGPSPNECIDLIRREADVCVIGNHDWAALGRPGVDVEAFNPQAKQAVLWTREQLTDDNRQFLEALPDDPVQPAKAENFLLTHASPREPVWEYIMTPTIAMENFGAFGEQICLVGHTHKPAIYRWRLHTLNNEGLNIVDADATEGVDDEPLQQVATVDYLPPTEGAKLKLDLSDDSRLILNPGSVGQPRDNDARAAYAILDLEEMSWEYRRVSYPIELTQSQMRAAQLPKRLIDRLSFGW